MQSGPEASAAPFQYAENGPATKRLALTPDALVELLAECFKKEPSLRPRAMEAVAEAFRNML